MKHSFFSFLTLFILISIASATCPDWQGRAEAYAIGTVMHYSESNYKVIRTPDNGWITPSNSWFWEVTTENCTTSSSSGSGTSSSSSDGAVLNLLQDLIARMDQEFTDPRDGQHYKVVKIGNQVWMARNLNYATAEGSSCYNDDISLCQSYGRSYDWNTANNVCPSGWHLASKAEWDALITFAGGEETAANLLKAASGWDENGNGSDTYGFSAIPGGYSSLDAGRIGLWWTSTEVSDSKAYDKFMAYREGKVFQTQNEKSIDCSVRCIQD